MDSKEIYYEFYLLKIILLCLQIALYRCYDKLIFTLSSKFALAIDNIAALVKYIC